MSTVTLNIGPKSYAIACADGQEGHISQLGAMIAEKYAQLGASRAPLEAQNVLFAALFLADELAEARKSLAASGSAPATPAAPAAPDTAAIDALNETIARLESELAAAREAAAAPPALAPASAPATPQPDLFGGPAPADPLTEAVAFRIEALAARAEASAAALEAAAASA